VKFISIITVLNCAAKITGYFLIYSIKIYVLQHNIQKKAFPGGKALNNDK